MDWVTYVLSSPVVLFMGMTALALVRANPLAIDRFTATVVGYSVTLGLLGLVFAALLVGLPLLAGRAGLLSSPVAVSLLMMLSFVGFVPLYRWLKRRVDLWFARGGDISARTPWVMRELLQLAHGSKRTRTFEAAVEAIDALRVEGVGLWIARPGADLFERQVWRGRPPKTTTDTVRRRGALAKALSEGRGGGVRDLAATALPTSAQEELWSNGLALAVPVRARGGLAGFFGVARKSAGTAFTVKEEAFVDAVGSQVALALEREGLGQARLGSYRLEGRLGTGGMAEVNLAVQQGPGGFERAVALKQLLPHLVDEPEVVALFLDEARVAAQLQHRHIAQIYEVGKEDDAFFIAMEYVNGPSVRTLVKRCRREAQWMPVPVAAGIASAVLEALAYAHSAVDREGRQLNVIHRDVTPSNIHLTRSGEVKLLDFGIAKAATQIHVTRTGVVRGTLPYMSPEQAEGLALDGRSDLYSLAAVLFEMLCGRRAFAGGPDRAKRPTVRRQRPEAPEALARVIEQALSWDAERRFATAEQMRLAVAASLERAGGVARPREIRAWLAEIGEATLPEEEEPNTRTATTRPAR
jgi:serine/threonine-protein kinase